VKRRIRVREFTTYIFDSERLHDVAMANKFGKKTSKNTKYKIGNNFSCERNDDRGFGSEIM